MAKFFSYVLILVFSFFVLVLTENQIGHESYPMARWFIGGWLVLLSLAGVLTIWRPIPIKLNPVIVFLCLLPLLGTEPLFENDQYRYFWEGKVLSEGFNPWREYPASNLLDNIDFPERHLVGFNKLTSPYSPLAVVYHSFFSHLSYNNALFLLQLFNAFLCGIVFWLLPPMMPVFAIGVAGLLGKEFAQSVHIDLLVWLFFFLSISLMKKDSVRLSALFFAISSLLKVNILIMFPWFFCSAFRTDKYRGVFFWLLILSVSVGGNVLGPLSFHASSGLVAFMEHWVWHSIVIAFWQVLGGDSTSGIVFANLAWGCGIAGLGLFCLKKQFDGWKWSTLLFTFTAFWRPAFNGWYFPWFGLSAALAGENLALIYGLLSPLAYVKYVDPSDGLLFVLIVTTHVPGVIYLLRQFFIKRIV